MLLLKLKNLVSIMFKVLIFIRQDFFDFYLSLVFAIPSRIGRVIRRALLSTLFNKLGSGLTMDVGCDIKGFRNISIGNKCSLDKRSMLYAISGGRITIGNNLSMNYNSCINASDEGSIEIGNDVLIAQNVVIRASNHDFRYLDITINKQGHKPGKIVIEENCWIGASVVILPNVVIGKNSIVGAGSVVTRDVAANSIVAGVPAKLIKSR